MGFYDSFFGSQQTQYTAYAILAAVTAICLTILFSASEISLGNRFLIIMFVIISVLPSVLLTLFELTCIVTGGTEPNQWWCSAFAWILTVFIVIYCTFVVIISLTSLFTYNDAVDNANKCDIKNKLPKAESDKFAKQMIDTEEEIHRPYHHTEYEHQYQKQYQQQYNIQANEPQYVQHELLPSPKPITKEEPSQQQANKEPTIAVQALTPASVISQQTQPVPVGGSTKSYQLPASDISSVGTYSVKSIDNFEDIDDYNNNYAPFNGNNEKEENFFGCQIGMPNCK